MKNNPVSGKLPALTGMRAVAAYMVFLLHYPIFNNDGGYQSILARLFNEFHTGVSFFFVLSGFLIAHLYYDTASTGKEFLRQFYAKRFARIYPIFFLLTAVAFLFASFDVSKGGSGLKMFLLNISFVKAFSQNTFFTGIIPSWSLTVEMCFYLAAPFMFVMMRRFGLFIEQILGLLLIGFILVQISMHYHSVKFFNSFHFILTSTFFGRCFEFFAGIALALYIRDHKEKVQKRMEKKGMAWITLISIIAIGGLYTLMMWLSQFSHTANSLGSLFGTLVNNFLFPIPVAFLFYGLITERSILQRILSTKMFETLGKSSYCFYLLHVGIIADAVFGIAHTASHPLTVLLGFTILNLFAVLLYRFAEMPLQKQFGVGFFDRTLLLTKAITARAEIYWHYHVLGKRQLSPRLQKAAASSPILLRRRRG